MHPGPGCPSHPPLSPRPSPGPTLLPGCGLYLWRLQGRPSRVCWDDCWEGGGWFPPEAREEAAGREVVDSCASRRRLACAGTVAAGRARCSSGEGRCADPFNVHCTKSLRCDLPKPGLAAFGMDSARTKTHGRATVACQKGGMYPTFDSAAGMGQIPLIPGFIPYLILRVAGFDSASGPIPVNRKHCYPFA